VVSCNFHGELEASEAADLDETVEVTLPSGRQTLALSASTLPCHQESDQVSVDHEVDVP
jgi:hypothetical protein